MTGGKTVNFTVTGLIFFILLALVLAASPKTGKFVIYVELIIILLIILVSYKKVTGVLFSTS